MASNPPSTPPSRPPWRARSSPPPSRLLGGLNAQAATVASSPRLPAARVGAFTRINRDDPPPAPATPVRRPPMAVSRRPSPGLFVSPGPPSAVSLSRSSLVGVRTDVAVAASSASRAAAASAPSSPGLSGPVLPSLRVLLPSQGKTQRNALLRVNRILANAVGRTGEARCDGCLRARKPVCWVGEPNLGKIACALCASRAQGCNAVSCLRSLFPLSLLGLLTLLVLLSPPWVRSLPLSPLLLLRLRPSPLLGWFRFLQLRPPVHGVGGLVSVGSPGAAVLPPPWLWGGSLRGRRPVVWGLPLVVPLARTLVSW